jgi:putative membrane protein
MYSAFIGLTLGGAPLVWRLARPANRSFWGGATGGLAAMAALAIAQAAPASEGPSGSGPLLLAVAGAAGAAAMILPGLSGAYLLLVLGQYEAILGAVDLLLRGLREFDTADLLEAGAVLLPVLIGIVVGATVISNAVRFALRRFRQATLGVLLGLLLGAVAGLWPFQASPPHAVQLGSAVVLAAAGFVLTWAVGRLGSGSTEPAR